MIKREFGDTKNIIKFDSNDHKYYFEDEQVPSVTTVTGVIDKGQGFYNWLVNQTAEYFEDNLEPGESYDEAEISDMIIEAKNNRYKSSGRAMKIGTIVHEFAEDFIQSKIYSAVEPDLPVNEKAKNSANQFLDWFSRIDIKPYETEQICFNSNHWYAGTYDLLAEIDGKLTILDHKTSKGIYDEYWLQVAAYLFASRQMRKLDSKKLPTQAGILRFPKNGEGFEVEIKDKDELWNHFWYGFIPARSILRWQQEIA